MRSRLFTSALVFLLSFAATALQGGETVNLEKEFYRAIDHGDVEAVLQLLHPAAREQVDRPVLAVWMEAINSNLGRCRSIDRKASFQTQKLTGTRVDNTSTVTFEMGVADASISVLDGQIIAFHVQSEKMRNWFQGPKNIEQYAETAETFISSFLTEDVVATRAMMHPVLQEVVRKEQLESMITKIANHGGVLKSLKLREHRFSLEGASPTLFLLYDIECERAGGHCEIEFQFIGMKGHLLGFDFQ